VAKLEMADLMAALRQSIESVKVKK
jgi:hypothetical protein